MGKDSFLSDSGLHPHHHTKLYMPEDLVAPIPLNPPPPPPHYCAPFKNVFHLSQLNLTYAP